MREDRNSLTANQVKRGRQLSDSTKPPLIKGLALVFLDLYNHQLIKKGPRLLSGRGGGGGCARGRFPVEGRASLSEIRNEGGQELFMG